MSPFESSNAGVTSDQKVAGSSPARRTGRNPVDENKSLWTSVSQPTCFGLATQSTGRQHTAMANIMDQILTLEIAQKFLKDLNFNLGVSHPLTRPPRSVGQFRGIPMPRWPNEPEQCLWQGLLAQQKGLYLIGKAEKNVNHARKGLALI